jgi:D-alanine-D-alanine ligase
MMRIGITFDLKSEHPAPPPRGGASASAPQPDDLQEEFDSPHTIDAIADVIQRIGHTVIRLGNGRRCLERLLADPPQFVFNFAEGHGVSRNREARVPAVLEMLGIPYTGSDPLTLAATLDKDIAKRLAVSAGLVVPWGGIVYPDQPLGQLARFPERLFPVIVKPAWEGSSKGIRQCCLVEQKQQLDPHVKDLLRDYGQPILVEEFIQGEEVTVGVIGNDPPRVFGMLQVIPRQPTERFVYSLEVKRDYKRQVRYAVPPELPPQALNRIEQSALTAWHALGCRDVARFDFRLRDDVPYFLEGNPLPGLNPDDSDLVYIAKGVGWSYDRLIGTILHAAFKRYGIS